MSKCGECEADVPDGWFMCTDCYMTMKGIFPGRVQEEKANE